MNNIMRQNYKELSEVERMDMRDVKALGLEFWEKCEAMGASRELSVAKTKIEEAVMWATTHITA